MSIIGITIVTLDGGWETMGKWRGGRIMKIRKIK